MPFFRADSRHSTDSVGTASSQPAPRRRHRLPPPSIFVLLVFLTQACSGSGSDPVIVSDGPTNQPTGSLSITPGSFLVSEGETLQLKAKLGSTVIGPSQVSWSVSPAAAGTIDP